MVTAAVLVGKRRWNIRMDNDVDVKLPEDGRSKPGGISPSSTGRTDLLDKDVTVVDLRQPDRDRRCGQAASAGRPQIHLRRPRATRLIVEHAGIGARDLNRDLGDFR